MNEASLDTTCMDASLKRSASSDALAADPKRPTAELPDEKTPLDSDSDYESESDSDSDFHSESDSDLPILDSFIGNHGFDILTSKVVNNSQLKLMATEIFQSVKRVVENGEQVATLPAQVKNMLKCPMFIQAFVEAYDEDMCLLPNIQKFKNAAEDQERLENLKTDTVLDRILQETGTTANIMGVLKIVMGYWSDQNLYRELVEAIKKYMKKYAEPAKPKVNTEVKEDDFIDLDVPPNIEGLKAAFATKYDGDFYKSICEEIDSQKSMYEQIFGSRPPDKKIKWLSILWSGEDFFVRVIGYGPYGTPLIYNE